MHRIEITERGFDSIDNLSNERTSVEETSGGKKASSSYNPPRDFNISSLLHSDVLANFFMFTQ